MKRVISIFLASLLLLSLCACQGKPAESQSQLKAGWGRVDITPDYPVPLSGYGGVRISEGYLDYQYVTCIAVSDGTETVLIYTMDLLSCNAGTLAEEYRNAVTRATGIPADKIFMGATHTHSGGGFNSTPGGKQFKADVLAALGKAGKDALEDLAPCQLLRAKTNLENMNFVRHYKLADGTYKGSNFREDSLSPIVDYATEPDDQMILLKFDRGEGKKDILFVNWQAHPDHAYANGFNNLSADFVGAMRHAMEEELDLLVGYYGGASGNINPFTEIKEDNPNLSMMGYGQKLAELATELLKDLEPVEGTKIKSLTRVHTFTIDHSLDHMLKEAREIQSIHASKGRDAATQAGLKYGFSSAYHANAIINRYSLPATEDRVLGAFCIGDLGFIEAKCEMFSGSSIYIKENSPFETTVVICGNSTYIPTEDAYDYHSYEADTSNFVRGSAEKMSAEFVDMLNALK